jgi:methionyl-tRNA formyltransferase
MENKNVKFAYFGSSEFAVDVLDELREKNFVPNLVITTPDKPQGRKLVLTSSPVKVWALEQNIQVLQPEKLNADFIYNLRSKNYDLFIVASYGKIIPKEVLEVPKHGTLNVHPSLLPHLRGASPIESAILGDDGVTGVTIMLMDEKMDHGPIVAQEIYEPEEWPPKASKLEKKLAKLGGTLLAEVIPDWMEGNIDAQEQDHNVATYTQKISKENALIDPKKNAYNNLLKIRAYDTWPRAYTFIDKAGRSVRVVMTEAHVEKGKLILDKVIPEGKKEMRWKDFERNL